MKIMPEREGADIREKMQNCLSCFRKRETAGEDDKEGRGFCLLCDCAPVGAFFISWELRSYEIKTLRRDRNAKL